jgi:hypothetical protein
VSVFAAIRSLLGSGRPRGTDFYDLAERESRVPEAELAIAEAAAAGGGPLAKRALRQLRETTTAYRLRSAGGSYELRIVVFENLVIRDVPRAGWTSGWIAAETAEGRPLELRFEIVEAGIIGLSGRTPDGLAWPKTWQVTPTRLDEIRAQGPWLQLPTPTELKADRVRASEVIRAWLGDPTLLRGRRGVIRAEPPVSNEALSAFATRESFKLPEAYRGLLEVADGIQVGPIGILGTRDAYLLDIPGPTRLVIAPPDEDGVLVLNESGAVEWIATDDRDGVGKTRAPDLRSWLAARLQRGTKRHPAD